jgi:hypothetical protein
MMVTIAPRPLSSSGPPFADLPDFPYDPAATRRQGTRQPAHRPATPEAL